MNRKEEIQIQIRTLEGMISKLQKEKEILRNELFQYELESSESGRKALSLYEQGWRLHNWGASLTDTNEETILKMEGEDHPEDGRRSLGILGRWN